MSARTKKSARAPSQSQKTSAKPNDDSQPVADSAPDESGFPPLQWHAEPTSPPTNRQRAWLGTMIAIGIAWLVVLGWLVWDSQ